MRDWKIRHRRELSGRVFSRPEDAIQGVRFGAHRRE
jgi:hypothetical protein